MLPFSFFRGRGSVMFRRAPKFCPAPSACCPLSVGKGTERGQRAQVFKDRPLCRHLSDLATAPPRRACRPPGHGEKRAKRCLFGAPSDKIPTFRQSIRRFPLSPRNSPPPHPVRAACFCPRAAARRFFLFFLRKAEKPCPSFRETVDSSGEFSSICGHISY